MLKKWALLVVILGAASPSFAQSPSTSAVVVVVTDQTGAILKDAKVTLVNTDTGASREAATANDGSATVAGLPVTGAYSVVVSKSGFGDQTLQNVTLRAGETA